MIHYYQMIPSGDVKCEIDGNLYAHTDAVLTSVVGGMVTVAKGKNVRMLRVFDKDLNIVPGESRIFIGKAGDAIGITVNLPFGVVAHNAQ
jgi:hypothetical protein